MPKSKRPHKHSERYLNERRRIKNKTRKLLKRIKHMKPETQDKIVKCCPIGRRRER